MTLPDLPIPAEEPKPRAAASLIVLRDDAQAGLQVLMLKRAERPGDQNSGAAVFPGGLLDASDRGHYARCRGLDDATASARMGLAADGLHYWVAAVRECFEEAGLLLANDDDGGLVDLHRLDPDEVVAMRRALHANQIGMEAVCERFGVQLATDRLAYYSHWITPKGMPKIFDTRFFITEAPAGQTAVADATETAELMWLTPKEALSRGFKLLNVTEITLKHLGGFKTAAEAIAWAHGQEVVPTIGEQATREATDVIRAKPQTPTMSVSHWPPKTAC